MPTNLNDEKWMALAIETARKAHTEDEVPIGAVIIHDHQVLGVGYNQPISSHDPTAHAEINAMRAVGLTLENYRLNDLTLYVTLEPCVMCWAAMHHARIKRCVYGAADSKVGVHSKQALNQIQFNHCIEVTAGVLQPECEAILRDFFTKKRH